MGPDILLTVFLVFLNGFFVAAEFAIVKVRISQIQVKASESFAGRIAEGVVNNLDGYLAATQLGITLASLGLGWVGEDVMTKLIIGSMEGLNLHLDEALAHRIALPIAFAVITVMHIVFGELAPKSLAIRYPTSTTLYTSLPLRAFYFVFRPFIYILNGFANFILKSIGIQPVPHAEIHSEDELKLIIAESAEGGAIRASERELIQNVFDFDDRTVRQVLKPRNQISAINVAMPIDDAIDYAIQEGYSRYPVYEENMDNILGFILTKDLLATLRGNRQGTLRSMTRELLFISSSKKISQVLRQFQEQKNQMAIVVNEFGGIVGLLTLEDIIEELVGDIQDETDTEMPIVEKISDNVFRVHAQHPVDEINAFLPFPLQESESYITLAGLIMEQSDELPEEGQELIIHPYQVRIIDMIQNSPSIIELLLLDVPSRDKDE
ncbi:MAG TPA: hemolysin family protein [Haliscomenobacter sp.]|uniref:hemolysin family protein n=1 Tax=Haliscomenobacter sp. TaxID=2717303 RepID=UPI002BFE902A|nr:hemolysin family protein [Haliscomenobacter sp.]HOY16537.1 hemolysin family protein [Haliscomenobacter sp.]HPH20543.1 hemolysin family protein [Haliscomenobacter sp.]